MAVLILDPELAGRLITDPEIRRPTDRDEVWEGLLVMPPSPNTEHQRLVSRVNSALSAVVDWDRGDQVVPGGNVSDRSVGWIGNYRIPDVLVCLAGGLARDLGTHWVGGPDVAVEIVSPGEDPRAKLDFYASVGTRELLVLDRDPWALELYQLAAGRLVLAGRSDAATPAVLASVVLSLTFQLRDGTPRPTIHIAHTTTGQTWTA